MEKYEVIRTLGKGTGGKVLLATEKGSGRYGFSADNINFDLLMSLSLMSATFACNNPCDRLN